MKKIKRIKRGINQKAVFINKLCPFRIASIFNANKVQAPPIRLNFINKLNPYLTNQISLIKPVTALNRMRSKNTKRKSKKNNHSDSDSSLNNKLAPIQTIERAQTFRSKGQSCEPVKCKQKVQNYKGPNLRLYSDESFDCFSEYLTPIKNVSGDLLRVNTISGIDNTRRMSNVETNIRKIVRLKKNVILQV
jgi:hypothetical protein